ncbi:hypothetical protein BC936DRAFT_147994 [Jimgerdemannia flammicorona]|uniref:Zn(2)-C6 fungal-type domain-containing protein n=1 Tax=Jimgerdemannia flammicorona TaxID=994334 RepID=A0A433D421_9FUNG|nr:hypothetical protein BC936DRAFT_147994 [Jimgerdemannia flammicorona]
MVPLPSALDPKASVTLSVYWGWRRRGEELGVDIGIWEYGISVLPSIWTAWARTQWVHVIPCLEMGNIRYKFRPGRLFSLSTQPSIPTASNMEVAATTRKRVKRNHPCEACRLQRRKCSPQPDGGPCQRCRLMKRECVYKRSAVPSGEVYDPTEDELRLLEEVDIVEEELEDLETEMLEITARKGVKGESGNGGSCSDSPPLLTSSPLNDASSSNPTSKGCLPLFSPHSMGQDSLPLYSDPVDDAVVSMKGHVVHPWEDHRKLEALNRFNWTVTLRSGRLQIRTNIRNMQDLVNIALNNYENMHDFDDPNNIISPTYLTNQRGGPVLRVTAGHNSLGDATFKVVKMAGRNTVTIMKYHNVKVRLERHAMTCLVETFFLCVNRVHPLIHRPTFERLFWLADDPASSALTCALCAVMTMRDCEHSLVVGTYPSPISRQMMGEHFAMRARELLEEQFDTPSLGTIVGLLCMILYRILSLEVSKAFQYSGLALQMGRVLVRQLDHSGPDPSKYTTEGWAERLGLPGATPGRGCGDVPRGQGAGVLAHAGKHSVPGPPVRRCEPNREADQHVACGRVLRGRAVHEYVVRPVGTGIPIDSVYVPACGSGGASEGGFPPDRRSAKHQPLQLMAANPRAFPAAIPRHACTHGGERAGVATGRVVVQRSLLLLRSAHAATGVRRPPQAFSAPKPTVGRDREAEPGPRVEDP